MSNIYRQLNQHIYPNKEYMQQIKLSKGNKELKGRYKMFKRRGNTFYINIQGKEKKVIKENDIDKILKLLYTNPKTQKNGRDSFYNIVRNRYIGISKTRVLQFLKDQENYQIHRPVFKEKVNKPILVSKPNSQWQADLIDMSKLAGYNSQKKWLLTVIDLFSKHAIVRALPNKKATTVAKAMKDILYEQDLMEMPKRIQTDNGSEFQNEFNKLLEDLDIKHIYSLPYKPTSQGAVERFNGTLKRSIHAYLTQHKTKRYIDVLPDLVNNYNNTVHTATGVAPNNIIDGISDAENKIIKRKIRKKQKALLETERAFPDIIKDDYVRVSLVSADKKIRKDENFRKKFLKQWTSKLYKVKKVTNPRKGRPLYILNAPDLPRSSYYRDELQLVDKENLDKIKQPKKVKVTLTKPKYKPQPVSKRRPKRRIKKPKKLNI